MSSNRYFSISEAAQKLGVSISTLRRWEREGKISVGRTPGGKRLFSEKDLDLLSSPLKVQVAHNDEFISSSISSKPNLKLGILFGLFIIALLSNFYLLSLNTVPSQVLGAKAFDLRTKIGELILFFLPDYIKSPQRYVQVPGDEVNLSLPSSLSLESLTVSGTIEGGSILTTGSINTNTLSGTRLIFSGDAPSIYPSTTNSKISLNAAGSGAINIGDSSTGDIYLAGGSSSSGCTITNSNGTLACSSDITSSGNLIGQDFYVNGGDILTDKTTLNLGSSSVTISIPNALGIGTQSPTSRLQVNTSSTGQIGAIIKAQASQTANLLELRNSVDTILAKINASGDISGRTLESTVTTGTAPLTVASTTVVTNLNSNYLQGLTAAEVGYSTNPNLILNSDFSRRNKWMTFMPEVFSDTSGWTAITGSLGSVASNLWTPTPSAGNFEARAGLSTWLDIRVSGLFQAKGAAVNDTLVVGIWADANNWLRAQLDANLGRLYITENVGGSSTNLTNTSDSGALTVNNYYWVELERQGTKIIVKWYSCGASAAAKSSCTLQNTASATTTLAATVGGYAYVRTFQAGTTHNIGGLATGDGGVYVEGWGPESWTVQFLGTKGGQAIGFDESADSGSLTTQWAMRAYIPHASRAMDVYQRTPDGSVVNSTPYSASIYQKVSGLGGSGSLILTMFQRENTANSNQGRSTLSDSGETSWTRKTTSFTTESGTRHMLIDILINSNEGGVAQSATGTAFFMLPQLEQGSTITPWRNAPADDDPIIWALEWAKTSTALTNTSHAEIDSRDLAINLFLPWDGSVQTRTQLVGQLNTTGAHGTMDMYYDGVLHSGGSTYGLMGFFFTAANDVFSYNVATIKSLTAGKHRVAVSGRTSSGTFTVYKTYEAGATGAGVKNLIVTATRGKFDLAEEYSVEDQSIEAGDVVRLSGSEGTIVEKVTGGYQQDILGIISTDPGITLSSTVELNGYQEKPNLRPVALQGRVPVKVTNENGPILRGDILTSSATKPGYAMKATKAGRSIGIAMDDLSEGTTEGKVMTFVNLGWYDPDVYLADTGELVINKETTSVLSSNNQDGDTELLSLPQTNYSIQNIKTLETIERVGAYNDLFVANLKVGRLDASEITSIESFKIELASLSGRLEFLEKSSSLSALLTLGASTASESSILNNLSVLGKTILSDLGITGTITNGLLSIDGLNGSISSLGDIKLKLPGGEVTIDTSGNLKIDGALTIKGSSVGSSVLPAGTISIEISTTAATPTSKIFVTGNTKTGKQPLLVTNKTDGKFTVFIEDPYLEDISFDWWVIGTE